MKKEDLHEYTLLLNRQFGISKTEIARIANIERTNLSKWLNHPDETYIAQETLEKLEHAVMYVAYGISTIAQLSI